MKKALITGIGGQDGAKASQKSSWRPVSNLEGLVDNMEFMKDVS